MAIEKTAPAVAAPAVTSAPTPLPAGETVDAYDAMSSVFDTLLEPAADPAVDPSEPTADTPAEPAAEPAAEPVAEAPAAEPVAETPSEPTAEPAAETDWEARFKELDAKTKAAPEPVAERPPVERPPADTPPLYTTDEATALTDYEENWKDVSRGESLKRRAEYQQLVNHIFGEVARVYGPLVEQGARAAETVAENTTLAAIRSVHSDYDDPMYDAVVSWADGLTGYRKKFAQQVIEEGEPQDVVDLITEFKSATGRSKPKVVAAAPVASAAPAVTELSATAKKAAKALGVVESKRSAAIPTADPNDFDSAWDEAVG